MNQYMQATEPKRSKFITYMAWIFIVLTSYIIVKSIIINIYPSKSVGVNIANEILYNADDTDFLRNTPPLIIFLLTHIKKINLFNLIIAILTLISAIGILKRKNWARKILIMILAFQTIWIAVIIFISWIMFKKNINAISIIGAVFGIIVIGLMGWLIKKLVSPSIYSEFICVNSGDAIPNSKK